jgi:cytochrome P450
MLILIDYSFAWMELNIVLAKILWKYDIELVNKDVNWLGDSRVHEVWWKPKLMVRFHKAFH